MAYLNGVTIKDGANLDAFSRLRTSNPATLFESSFIYDLQPLVYEQLTATGGAVAHDATNSAALLNATTSSGSRAAMQSYRFVRYQPGKSQLSKLTFCMGATAANSTKRIGLYDSLLDSGFYLERAGTAVALVRRSTTTTGNTSVAQASWNIDPMDGSGPSGITLDLTKAQILIMDFQWLGVGRVRVGFDIDGIIYYVHQFLHANSVTTTYIKQLTLPVYAENINTGASSATTMRFICSSIESEGGTETPYGYTVAVEQTANAASGARTAILSLRPRLTFNNVTNRIQMDTLKLSLMNPGANPVYWELCVGNTFSVAPTWANVNANYSAMDYSSAPGTLSGVGVVIDSGYVQNGTGAVSGAQTAQLLSLYPMTLNQAGSVRDFGTYSLVVTGVGGVSNGVRASMQWKELR